MSDLVLGHATYRNYCEMWRVVGALADNAAAFEVVDRSDRLLVRSHYADRVPQMVLDPIVQPGEEAAWTSALIDEWVGAPVSLMVGIPPGHERGELAKALQQRGFMRGSRPSVAMARQIKLADDHYDPEVERADSEGDLDDARAVLARIFVLPKHVFAYYTPVKAVRTFIVRDDGMVVAAACLCPFAGVAGVYSVGVLAPYRGRGYARRLVLHLLGEAAKSGLTTAVLSCERSLVPLYRRLGFAVVWELTTYWMEVWWP